MDIQTLIKQLVFKKKISLNFDFLDESNCVTVNEPLEIVAVVTLNSKLQIQFHFRHM